MRRVPWLIVIAVVVWWALNGLISTIQIVALLSARGEVPPLQHILHREAVGAAVWVPCTLWLLWATARQPLERERWAAAARWLLLALLAMAVFRELALLLLDPRLDWRAPPPADVLAINVLKNLLRGCLIVGVGHALVYAQRSRVRERQAQELQERLTQARLDALSAQLNPHFLFNALNSIAEMVHHDADAADRMLVQLGGLLRYSLESSRQQHASLREELGAIDCYLGIEQVRLGERLRFRREVDESLLHARVPRLMLQPLVENAVTHSVAPRSAPGTILLRARAEAGRLVLEVQDDGAGSAPRPGFGLGLANTRARLECLYGEAQQLEMATMPDGGTRVRLTLPLRMDPG